MNYFYVLLQELDGRYNALLQMYGEKVEEANELRMDLTDVKDLYKAQVNKYTAERDGYSYCNLTLSTAVTKICFALIFTISCVCTFISWANVRFCIGGKF